MSRPQFTADLHFKQKCLLNLYKDISECLFNMLRGVELDLQKLKIHHEILNYLVLIGIMDNNEYDNLNETLDYVIEFFTP